MIGVFNTITINGTEIFRPNDFEVKRKDVFQGEYTTCTGKLIADRIGWQYDDMSLKWDMLTDSMMAVLVGLVGEASLSFEDSDGEHTERIIRRGFTNTPSRVTKNGKTIWTGVEMEITFLDVHPLEDE